MKSVDELTELFRSQGLKATPQRQAIFRALSASGHPTAESVYAAVSEQMPTISLRTVYQTLNDLASMGELVALQVGNGPTRFDPNLAPHHHLVCDRCGGIQDLHMEFPGVAAPVDNPFGFEVTSTEIVFRGRCATCAGPDDEAAGAPPGPSGHAPARDLIHPNQPGGDPAHG